MLTYAPHKWVHFCEFHLFLIFLMSDIWIIISLRCYYLSNGLSKKIWPLYQGKRAGQLVKSREAFRRYKIDIVQSREVNRVEQTSQISTQLKTHNPTNCVYITTSNTVESIDRSGKAFVPRILLSNVMSVAPEIDEVRLCTTYANLHILKARFSFPYLTT